MRAGWCEVSFVRFCPFDLFTPLTYNKTRWLALIICGVLLAVVLASAAFSHGWATNVAGDYALATLTGGTYVPASASLPAAAFALSGGDNAFYVGLALDFVNQNGLSAASQFAIRQWPPGMGILLAIPGVAFRDAYPVGAWSLLVTVALWWCVFMWCLVLCRTARRVWAVFIALLILVYSPPFQTWFFGSGTLYTEGLTAAFSCLAILSAFSAFAARQHLVRLRLRGRSIPRYGFVVTAGLALAAGAYLRAVYEFVVWAATLMVVVALLALVIRFLYLQTLKRSDVTEARSRGRRGLRAALMPLVGIVIVAQLAMVPWRVYTALEVDGSAAWTSQADAYWGHRWMPDGFIAATGQTWFTDWGGNVACRIDPIQCERIAAVELQSADPYSGSGTYSQADFRSLTLSSYAHHPIALLTDRAALFFRQWTAVSSAPRSILLVDIGELTSTGYARGYGILFAISTLLALIAVIRGWRTPAALAFLVYLAIGLGTVVPLVNQVIEARYLYSLMLSSYVVVLLVFGTMARHKDTM
jgi:hypothetical protein